MVNPKYLTGDVAAINEFIDLFDVFLLDCDGVIWSGDHVYEGVVETLELLRSRGKKTVFVTNNSTKSRQEYLKKFTGLGIPSDVEEIFGSAYSASIYISRILKLEAPKNKVFVIGEAGIEQELKSENVPFIGGTDPAFRRDITPEDFKGLADGSLLDPEVGCVLAGLDFHFNYLKLSHALQYLRRGAVFLATNVDSTFPMSHGFFPGAGSISMPLIYSTGQKPVALGKPSQAMMDAVEGKFQLNRGRTCMIGDRLDTDIKFGVEGKLGGTLAVLTGVSKKEDWEAADAVAVPAYFVDKLSDLAKPTTQHHRAPADRPLSLLSRPVHSWDRPSLILPFTDLPRSAMDAASSSSVPDEKAQLLDQRQKLTHALTNSPYDLFLYLDRAVVYSHLGYPDLAAGDAYRALLLADEVRDESFEYHEQAKEALQGYSPIPCPDVLNHGALAEGIPAMINPEDVDKSQPQNVLAHLASIRSFQILSLSLLLCGCLKSALQFCERGLSTAPTNKELLEIKGYIEQVGRRRLRRDPGAPIDINDLPDRGVVRREVYPWNNYEPDRFSQESLTFLNQQLATMAPKCEVRVSTLPVLLEGETNMDGDDTIPTCKQLGLFAKEDIAAGETVLEEYSLLTANNRHKESSCDACGSELPPLSSNNPTAVSCPECYDTIFCDEFCYNQAKEQYHPAVCDTDVDSIAKDPDAADIDQSLYLLLLARLLAMSTHQDIHPLEVKEIKYIWGDFVPSELNDIDSSINAAPPPEWTLPFSFKYNIEIPLHMLEKMDINIYETLDKHDLWVFNTAYAKFRGTASARKNPRDGRPDVAAVHPFWCLANHDCNPNVTWEWGGKMVLSARQTRPVGNKPGGIKADQEILNHYCDVNMPVHERREWAQGSLGGWCMCERCRDDSGEAKKGNNGVNGEGDDKVMINGVA
ncbi:HAD-like domain-containing protein [Cladorrhinum sp. PSN332]|nr:HAD-like domain-containing protein [Cladorrhinum sp. PSN332]